MIKVLERIALWIGTPIAAFFAGPWALLVLILGAFAIYRTWPTPEEVMVKTLNDPATESKNPKSQGEGSQPQPRNTASSSSSSDDESPHNCEEGFLARERYEEWCKSH